MSFFHALQVSILTLCLLAIEGPKAFASTVVSQPEEDSVYNNGVALRKQGRYREALEIFRPLAEGKNAKAQHNVGSCYLHLGDDYQAYLWFTRAADRGLKESTKNLSLLNQWDRVLPDQLWQRIHSYLSMADISNLKNVTQRAHTLALKTIADTDFYHSPSIFAQEWRSVVLRDFKISPEPDALKLMQCYCCDGENIEIHFRDSEHLRAIKNRYVIGFSDEKITYVRDASAVDYDELVPIDEDLVICQAILVESRETVSLDGSLGRPYGVAITPRGKISLLGDFTPMTLNTLECVNRLADALDNIEASNYRTRFMDAMEKSVDAQCELYEKPLLPLSVLCPSLATINFGKLGVQYGFVFYCKVPPIYLAQDQKQLDFIKLRIPFFSYTCCVDETLQRPGILIDDEIKSYPSIIITSPGDMVLLGELKLQNYAVYIESRGNMWSSLNVTADLLSVKAKNNFIGSLYTYYREGTKPEDMDSDMWEVIVKNFKKNRLCSIEFYDSDQDSEEFLGEIAHGTGNHPSVYEVSNGESEYNSDSSNNSDFSADDSYDIPDGYYSE